MKAVIIILSLILLAGLVFAVAVVAALIEIINDNQIQNNQDHGNDN